MYGTTVEGNRAHWMMVPLSLGAGCCYPLWSLVTIWFGENSTQAGEIVKNPEFLFRMETGGFTGNCKDTKQVPTVLETLFQCLFSVLFWNWMIGRNSVVLEALKTVPSVEYVPIIVAWWSSFLWRILGIWWNHVNPRSFFCDFTQSLQVKIKWVPIFGADFPIFFFFFDQIPLLDPSPLSWVIPSSGRNWGTSFLASVRVAGEECDCSTAGSPRTEADAGTTGTTRTTGPWDDWPRIGLNMFKPITREKHP